MTNREKNNIKKAKISAVLGRRKTNTRRPLIETDTPTYPMRSYALGKSSGSTQGVAGWRTNYHRPK